TQLAAHALGLLEHLRQPMGDPKWRKLRLQVGHHSTRHLMFVMKCPQTGMSALCQKRTISSLSITSFALVRRVLGTDKPSAFAVLRLIAISNLVGSCTGSSAGFAPRRIRST